MAIMAAGIVAGGSLLAGGLSAWLAHSAQGDALKESRRAEGLRIKFANEENSRQESQFSRTASQNKEVIGLNKRKESFDQMQGILDNINGMHRENQSQFQKVTDSFAGRGRK